MAVLFKNVHSVRRSISLPDLSRLHIMFNKSSPRLDPNISRTSETVFLNEDGSDLIPSPPHGDTGSASPDELYFDSCSMGDIGGVSDSQKAHFIASHLSPPGADVSSSSTNSTVKRDDDVKPRPRSRFDSGFGDGISSGSRPLEDVSKTINGVVDSSVKRKLNCSNDSDDSSAEINRNARCRRSKRKERPRGYVFEDPPYE